MRKKNAILIIDAQYDFCNPNGALYVSGADADMKRLSDFIHRNKENIDHICVTLDSHPINDISHPAFWQDKAGNFPPPFTQITLAEVRERKWTPRFSAQEAIQYLTDLEAQGQFPHFIWTEHCLTGSKGASLDDTLMDVLREWSRSNGKPYQAVTKGTNPLTEHFGIFMAQIPLANAPETQLNQSLLDELEGYENVYLAGQAKSHCVATSLRQAMEYAPKLANKMIVLDDCMSDVTGLGHLGTPIYEAAKQRGIKFAKSTDAIA
ncbi:MAG: isochorismatase family protein [Cytophagales bacterium]|nr:MAG: isochorismatase family protein [Cytophagales bacterium]